MKHIAILGSTGSIGTQTLDIISQFPDLFKTTVLTANHNWELLAQQAKQFKPDVVVIAQEALYEKLKDALKDEQIEVEAGSKAIAEAAALPQVDITLTAMVGYSGLIPTINAINAGKTIALANKETLVVAGEIITRLVKENHTRILPVDSEHSAIFQCLVGEDRNNLSKILLTASGGPFRTLSSRELENVTVEHALNHPNWDMGAKVTIDSASMMNKGFEMIEARWLFDTPPEKIEILVHPQSIVHSMVEFCDGSVKAQLGIPDMHIPIQYALGYPERLPAPERQLNWKNISHLDFFQPDYDKFPLLRYAFEAIKAGGNMPCILNAANEVAVKAFLERKIRFTDMPRLAKYAMERVQFIPNPTLEELVDTNRETVERAKQWVKNQLA
ncbi:MAG: 1-deoxy-D-xylulose-5-phosphate reductoisomerase [Muribaculaceae bacterium]|nr:1-deoxy-D-xylulose-5-phosphate reductoisomerase [Muribaculaceae bacterium]